MPFLKDWSKPRRCKLIEKKCMRQGLRHAIFNTVGDRYIGEWNLDLKTGKGSLVTRHRELYEGDFLEGYRHGFGVLAYELEKIFYMEYRGGWRKGRMHGFGIRKYRDGSVYIGDWKNGKRHGYGLMWYTDGNFYAGEFVKDQREGLGMLVRPDINRYEGSWKGDLKHGQGKFLHLDTGQFQRGVWNRNLCVYSTMRDMKYRQSAIYPTKYPIQCIEWLNVNELCDKFEMNALEERVNSCLSFNLERISVELNETAEV